MACACLLHPSTLSQKRVQLDVISESSAPLHVSHIPSSSLVLSLQVHFKSWPASFNDVKFDDLVASPSANGNGFAILNNTIGNLR